MMKGSRTVTSDEYWNDESVDLFAHVWVHHSYILKPVGAHSNDTSHDNRDDTFHH